MKCRICDDRRPRRYCPGVRGDICSVCCGQEREVSVDCPLDCEYLLEARVHERHPDPDPAEFPNQDIPVTEGFLRAHEPLLLYLASGVLRAALETPGAVDHDVREALASLIRTYRTLQTGLMYESMPQNPLAAAIHERMQAAVADLRKRVTETGGTVRDAEVLGVLAFLQRLEIQHHNGRRKGRAFVDFLSRYFVPAPSGVAPREPASPLLLP